jgi:hypothetical protein
LSLLRALYEAPLTKNLLPRYLDAVTNPGLILQLFNRGGHIELDWIIPSTPLSYV